MDIGQFLKTLSEGIPIDKLPPARAPSKNVPHAPKRTPNLSVSQKKQALKNALRYFPNSLHELLLPEFEEELHEYGHIYMYRFIPSYPLKAYPLHLYTGQSKQTQSIQHMIMNVLDPQIAQFPEELITYGGNGAVFQNWAQYHLTMKYLSIMTEDQTLVLNNGHPQGLFPSSPAAPRVMISNGIPIPNYSSKEQYEQQYALGVQMYGEMTAGCFCYIGPQGIVHGTALTLQNMARKFFAKEDMAGMVYVTSGLGGMSGAQPKAADICGCISVIAEIDENALNKRYHQGWLKEKSSDLEFIIQRIKQMKLEKKGNSIGYLGNIVDLWERLAKEDINLVDLGSDQTSLHNPYYGGYYPAGINFQEGKKLMIENNEAFRFLVKESLKRQVNAINTLVNKGMRFWDYGNSFLLEAGRSGADVWDIPQQTFKFPSYFENVMDDIFGLGFGPFRWVCTSADPEDLKKTDIIAEDVMQESLKNIPNELKSNYQDNLRWIQNAESNGLVVGSQARILYADSDARVNISLALNKAIREGLIKGTVVLSRDHHDVGGTDSPFRETSAIKDGSKFTADMAIQNHCGGAVRGATLVAIHNGGGTGWGEVIKKNQAINGGMMLVLDGASETDFKIKSMLKWDVNNGTARRAWSGNSCAQYAIKRQMDLDPLLKVTLANECSDDLLDKFLKNK